MPTDLRLPLEKRRRARSLDTAIFIVAVVIVPLTACLCGLLLALMTPAFTAALVTAAIE